MVSSFVLSAVLDILKIVMGGVSVVKITKEDILLGWKEVCIDINLGFERVKDMRVF